MILLCNGPYWLQIVSSVIFCITISDNYPANREDYQEPSQEEDNIHVDVHADSLLVTLICKKEWKPVPQLLLEPLNCINLYVSQSTQSSNSLQKVSAQKFCCHAYAVTINPFDITGYCFVSKQCRVHHGQIWGTCIIDLTRCTCIIEWNVQQWNALIVIIFAAWYVRLAQYYGPD